MKRLPSSKVYEKEFKYMVWGSLIEQIAKFVIKKAHKNETVLDLMCGPGYLLNLIKEKRPDLNMLGVDIDKRSIDYSKVRYNDIQFVRADVLRWKAGRKFKIILCTGGLHHIPYGRQKNFLKKVKSLLDNGGVFILADPFIEDYNNENERRLAAARLGYKYIKEAITRDAPKSVVETTIDIMYNDVMLDGEFKTSIAKFKIDAEKIFGKVQITKIWPRDKSEDGDYFIIIR